MPSKIQLDENLHFLYICLQKSDMTSIDFNAVALSTSLKAPAARMRYTRLKRQIESGSLIGTHGQPFTRSDEMFARATTAQERKRKTDINAQDIGKRKRNSGEEQCHVDREDDKKASVYIKKRAVKSDEAAMAFAMKNESEEDDIPLAKIRSLRVASSVKAFPPSHTRNFELPIPCQQEHSLLPDLTYPAQKGMHHHIPQHNRSPAMTWSAYPFESAELGKSGRQYPIRQTFEQRRLHTPLQEFSNSEGQWARECAQETLDDFEFPRKSV